MKKFSYFPSQERFKALALDYTVIPVYADILADMDTPVSAFSKIDDGGDVFLLESVEGGEKWGRYSILGARPRLVVRSKGGRVEVIEAGVATIKDAPAIDCLRSELSRFTLAPVPGLPRFCGGAIGFMGYDCVREIEKLPDESPRELDLFDMYFIFTDTFLVFDNVEHKIQVISNAYINDNEDVALAYDAAVAKINAVVETLRKKAAIEPLAPERRGSREITSNFSKGSFIEAVERIKQYISAGDIIQTVLSQRFSTALRAAPFDIYRALRVINPSPYMFFLRLGDTTLAGSSPEILVKVEDGRINVKPIAGTRKRGRDESEDEGLAKELVADPKERAEHIMLVDLGRNDVGRVAEPGTITVDGLMSIERYSHVMHMVSNVTGQMKKGMDAFDCLKACFPAGTLTGAPKVRAMEIIEELEPCKREIYGGSIGYVGFDGNMDMCIAIRTVVIKDGKAHVQAGAGIVADSVSEKEYEETENKARAMIQALEMAEEGL